MYGLKELLLEEKARLQEIEEKTRNQLKNAPKGTLRISKSNGPYNIIIAQKKIPKKMEYICEKPKVCYFDGTAIELPHKIKLGNKDSCFFVGTKYTSLESLLNATKADEIVFG